MVSVLRLIPWIAGAVIAAVPPAPAATPADGQEVRRVLALVAAVGEEYREGIEDGTIVRPVEYEEAKSFLAEARQRFEALGAAQESAAEVATLFDDLSRMIMERTALAVVEPKLTALRERIGALTGVSEPIFPPAPPSAAHGRALFAENCATCHGERGDGRGPSAAGLSPPPANFTDTQFIRGETPYDFYHIITLGKRASAMPAWDGVLSVQDRWDLVSYLWTLAPTDSGIAEGQGVYLMQCASCHGATGSGQGSFASTLVRPLPDLSRLQTVAKRTDAELFAATTNGVPGTPMPAFGRVLEEDERWKVVAFVRALSLGGPTPPAHNPSGGPSSTDGSRLAALLRLLGRTYEKAWVDNRLSDATAYREAVALLLAARGVAQSLAQRIEPSAPNAAAELRAGAAELERRISGRLPAAETRAQVDALAGLVQSIAPPGAVASAGDQVDPALNEGRALLEQVVAAYDRGDRRATSLASDAYFAFEPLEQQLGARAPALKTSVEERFLTLRKLLQNPGQSAEVLATVEAIRDDYDAVRAALRPHTSESALFVQSATIILREGFEVVLVIGALLAYVVKAGRPGMRRPIYGGATAGILLSVATALVVGQVLAMHPGSAEVLEGITMLLAAAVLFLVSYWLVSKAEADKWQQYIRGKVQGGVTTGRSLALASAAFLAVYREGVETVLFCRALYASAPAGSMTISAGVAAGAVALLIVYVLFRRLQVQIPIRQFFFVTGLLLYVMAAIFAGQGIHELQEAGVVSLTAVPWTLSLPLLGVYPAAESLAVQAVFVLLLAYATLVTVRASRRAGAPDNGDVTVELRALRSAIDTLHAEIRGAVRGGPGEAVAAPQRERLEALLAQAEHVAHRVSTTPLASGRTIDGGRRDC